MKKVWLGLFIFFVLIYIAPLGVRPIAIIDESRYAEIPREMLANNDWVTPSLNGLRYFEKPVMGYWLNAMAMKVFGYNGFAIRIASALATGVSALLLFMLARHFLSLRIALFTVSVFLSMLLVCLIGVTSVLDAQLSMFVTGILVSFFFATEAASGRKRFGWLVLCGVFCACSFLTKGFLAFAVPVITAVPYLLFRKDWRNLFFSPWLPLVVAVLLILPWGWAVHQRESDFWSYFFWEEHINRFVPESVIETVHNHPEFEAFIGEKAANRLIKRPTQHEESFWYFIPIFLLGALPWTFQLPAACGGLRKKKPRSPLLSFSLWWFAMPFLFFSMSSGKLGTYILPCFAPAALLIGAGLDHYFESGHSKGFNRGALTASWLMGLVGVVLASLFLLGNMPAWVGSQSQTGLMGWLAHVEPLFRTNEWHKFLMALAGVALWVLLARKAASETRPVHKMLTFAMVPAMLFLCAHFALPRRLAVTESAESFLKKHKDRTEHAILGVDKYLTHSACFFYERDDIFLFDSKGEFEYGLMYPDSIHRLMTIEPPDSRFLEVVNDPQRRQPLVLILDTDHFEDRKQILMDARPDFLDSEKKMTLIEYGVRIPVAD
ncbi:MAG: hypothetical protein EOL87_05920 [Spartobacteria bacterium]|nr:hypothetical protein [Spartobacteria bacterium]